MDVQRAMPAGLEKRLREDKTVGGDHQRVGSGGAHALDVLHASEIYGLEHLQAMVERKALDRTRERTHAATGGPVGLRQDKSDFVARGHQARQCSLGKLGRASED